MSALVFVKHASNSMCATEGCIRAGRWAILLCGYPVEGESPYTARHSKEVLCGQCKKEAEDLWEEMSGAQDREAVAA